MLFLVLAVKISLRFVCKVKFICASLYFFSNKNVIINVQTFARQRGAIWLHAERLRKLKNVIFADEFLNGGGGDGLAWSRRRAALPVEELKN